MSEAHTLDMHIITETEAGTTLPDLLKKVADSHKPLLITGNENNAVLISEGDWWAIHETLHLISIPDMRESINVQVRFGGIANFEEVHEFFAGLAERLAQVENLHYFRPATERSSTPNRLCFEMEFDNSGAQVRILCSKVSVSDAQAQPIA